MFRAGVLGVCIPTSLVLVSRRQSCGGNSIVAHEAPTSYILHDRTACGPVLLLAQQVSGVDLSCLLRHHPAWCGFL
eukprot:2139278-Heterocapsa_arctica.AAC.1